MSHAGWQKVKKTSQWVRGNCYYAETVDGWEMWWKDRAVYAILAATDDPA